MAPQRRQRRSRERSRSLSPTRRRTCRANFRRSWFAIPDGTRLVEAVARGRDHPSSSVRIIFSSRRLWCLATVQDCLRVRFAANRAGRPMLRCPRSKASMHRSSRFGTWRAQAWFRQPWARCLRAARGRLRCPGSWCSRQCSLPFHTRRGMRTSGQAQRSSRPGSIASSSSAYISPVHVGHGKLSKASRIPNLSTRGRCRRATHRGISAARRRGAFARRCV